ncbi:hypothetical protein DERP_013187 [Dermatophagoides pteronyssinus]|uniref:Uncharacterized protein n=1 Tax=Dermatophagoides pteronyssinus TaxID=6956 RepID=A0ABQ8J3C8_DERPT|nr:hypothetical protein DERP_013187 [Dermatophagoides pteronyssinus]
MYLLPPPPPPPSTSHHPDDDKQFPNIQILIKCLTVLPPPSIQQPDNNAFSIKSLMIMMLSKTTPNETKQPNLHLIVIV